MVESDFRGVEKKLAPKNVLQIPEKTAKIDGEAEKAFANMSRALESCGVRLNTMPHRNRSRHSR